MGLFDRFSRIKDPVRGTARVVSTTRAPHEASAGNCRMNLVVTVPGRDSFAVDEQFIVKVKKWPRPGLELPIAASRSNPEKFKILWDEVTPWSEVAGAQAAQLAASLNQDPVPGSGQAPGGPTVLVNGRQATPEEVAQFEAMTGMDLDGDGRIAGQPGQPGQSRQSGPAAPPPAGDDRIAALERLVALREAGALTDDEFADEKARILGD